MSLQYVLEFPKADRGIAAVAFSPDGNKLATVAMDNSHTMYVWDISKGAKKRQRQLEDKGDALVWCKTTQGAPPAVRSCNCRYLPWPSLFACLATMGRQRCESVSIQEPAKLT